MTKKKNLLSTKKRLLVASLNNDLTRSTEVKSFKMVSNHFSRADVLYRRIVRNTFFSKGWGSIETYRGLQKLKRDIFDAEKFREIVHSGSVKIDKEYDSSKQDQFSIVDGHFVSPIAKYYPGLLPKESEIAYFQAIIPKERRNDGKQPMCIQLAGTGDHNFWRRRNLVAKPLIKETLIGSILLMNPFYGCRKPKTQTRSSLNHVVDLLLMGCALIVETSVLLNWCADKGFGPLAVTGVSMGGHMASLAGTFVPKPVAIIPCLACTTASPVFTKGVLSKAVAWSVLEEQLEDYSFLEELRHICQMIESDGLNANNPGRTAMNLSAFPQELMNIMNNSVDLSSKSIPDYNIESIVNREVIKKNPVYEQSVSFEMLAKSFQKQVGKNIRDKIPKDLSILTSILGNSKKPTKYQNAVDFLIYLLDITTHLSYYKKPVDPCLSVFVQAQFDGYIPNMDCPSPLELWPGCRVKYVDSGHIFAALYKQDVFRKIISETLDKC
ncbi:protein ABHD18-like [Dendronephthya gigantea]|uniref:protein ABHD18-like n=1 Tax=Dendronephthya gigantea TaxID=151771 RepID=UPI00106B8136|nr:protein ABHD18-like [Dendronephthya gigantea]